MLLALLTLRQEIRMTFARNCRTLCGLATVVILAACSPDSSTPTAMEPSFSKGGSTQTDPTATWLLPLADDGLAFKSDGQYSDGTNSVYANGVCNVDAKIFATTQKSNSGDAVIQTNAAGKGKSCERSFTLRYPDGHPDDTVRSFNNLRNLQNTTNIIAVGETVKRLLILNPGAMKVSSRCDRLMFGVGDNPDNGAGSDSVLVTRLDARTWRVRSNGGDNLAWCQKTGELFAMPVDFQVVASYDLPQ
ncbi:MAG TPA: hypothetical protein VMN60_01465 [Longimicrobiales bacterium]|nr:hypothetical protein [Longimicrobiales bacterium]